MLRANKNGKIYKESLYWLHLQLRGIEIVRSTMCYTTVKVIEYYIICTKNFMCRFILCTKIVYYTLD